jgi:oligoendopeptidase F
MRTTLFRQTLFAEFELKIHESVERGEPLTATR